MAKTKREKEFRDFPMPKLKSHPRQQQQFGDVSEADLQALMDDIEQNGLRQRIEVLPDGTILVGHQRVRAAKRLGWKTIPAIVRHDLADDPVEAERLFLRDNDNRRHEAAVERMLVAIREQELSFGKSIRKFDTSERDQARSAICKRLNQSPRNVNRYFLATNGSEAMLAALRRGDVRLEQAASAALLAQEVQDILAESLESISSSGLSEKERKQRVQEEIKQLLMPSSLAKSTKDASDRMIRALKKELPLLQQHAALIDEKRRSRLRYLLSQVVLEMENTTTSNGHA